MSTMTTPVRTGPWQTRPGWGISADLTPPEVVQVREVARTRRRLIAALIGLLLVVAVAFGLAFRHHAVAENTLQQEQATADRLRAQAASFRDVTDMQRTLTRIEGQTATVMAGDVDLEALATKLTTSLAPGMRITSQTITLDAADPAADPAAADPATAADPDAPTIIGTVLLVGTSRAVDDLATYVERLQAVAGITDVVPTSNTASEKGVSYTVSLSLTSQLLSNRFAVDGATS